MGAEGMVIDVRAPGREWGWSEQNKGDDFEIGEALILWQRKGGTEGYGLSQGGGSAGRTARRQPSKVLHVLCESVRGKRERWDSHVENDEDLAMLSAWFMLETLNLWCQQYVKLMVHSRTFRNAKTVFPEAWGLHSSYHVVRRIQSWKAKTMGSTGLEGHGWKWTNKIPWKQL